jgi:hypothetical protein
MGDAPEGGRLRTPEIITLESLAMSSILAFKIAAQKRAPKSTALDLVVARFAREHDEHLSPILGCYLCLHNEPRSEARELPAAA